jgi:hypothetical protein
MRNATRPLRRLKQRRYRLAKRRTKPNLGGSIKERIMGKRPAHVKAPDYLSKSPPVPEPKDVGREPDPDRPDPVRYGDWELKGVAIDF